MTRVDAHLHYWYLGRGDYTWPTPRDGALYRDFMPGELEDHLADCAVDATVLVQAAATEAETRFLIDLAHRHPSIAGVVGWVDFEANDVADRIRNLREESGGKLKGLRPMIQDISDPNWLARSSIDAAFDAMLDNDLSFDALVRPRHLPILERRLQKHPALRAVLDHAGKPDIAGLDFGPWAAQIERIARRTSSFCKLSGLLTQADPGAATSLLDPFVKHIFTCFGPNRIMWGSDWPVVTSHTPYEQWLEIALELVHQHAPGHEEAVFAGNATRFYRLVDRERLTCP